MANGAAFCYLGRARWVRALLQVVPVFVDDRNDRIKSVIAVGVIHALIGYALIVGLGAGLGIDVVPDALKVINLSEDPPPPPPEAEPLQEKTLEPAPELKAAPKDPEGAAAPPNIKSKPTEIVAPKPEIPLPVPPPVNAAPIAGTGAAATSGNAPVRGPGTGAGGVGDGTGSGRYGNGGGGGGGAGMARRAVWIGGRLRNADYPSAALRANAQGVVYMRFVVGPNGRITSCRVTRSSGNAALDQGTCQLVKAKLRYRPARDRWGRPVSDVTEGEHEWVLTQQADRWYDADIPDDR